MAKRRRKKTSRNLYTPRYFLANGRRSLARLMRNPDMGVLLGIGMGALGFVAARVLTRESARITSLPAYVKDNAGMVIPAVGAVATLALAKPLKLSDSTRNLIVAGMGISAVDQAIKRSNQPLLMASYAAPPPVQIPAPAETPAAAPDAGPAAGSYYEEGDVMGSYFDVSHQGAPYKGLLGLGEAMYATAGMGSYPTRRRGGSSILGEYVSQPVLGDIMYATAGIEQVATITPSDGVRKAQFMPPVRPITTPFVNPARGSGLFYGSLFSGTM